MAKFEVIYKFSDVIREIEADSLEEAQEIADNDIAPKEDTYCFDTEVEQI